jgi:hypothetical protein
MITSSCWVKLCIPSGEFIIGSCMFTPSCWEKLCIPDGDVITVFGRSYVSQIVMLSLCLGEVMYPECFIYHWFIFIYTTVFGRGYVSQVVRLSPVHVYLYHRVWEKFVSQVVKLSLVHIWFHHRVWEKLCIPR